MHTIFIFFAGCFVGAMAGILVTSLRHVSKASDPDTDEWKCRRCGCDDLNPCITDEGPCSWVEENLCSACYTIEDYKNWKPGKPGYA